MFYTHAVRVIVRTCNEKLNHNTLKLDEQGEVLRIRTRVNCA